MLKGSSNYSALVERRKLYHLKIVFVIARMAVSTIDAERVIKLFCSSGEEKTLSPKDSFCFSSITMKKMKLEDSSDN